MLEWLLKVKDFVWGAPLLLLLVGTGFYLTLRLGVFQMRRLPMAFRLVLSGDESGQGDVSSFAALCIAGWYRKYCWSGDSCCSFHGNYLYFGDDGDSASQLYATLASF